MKYLIRTFGDLYRSKRIVDTMEECYEWLDFLLEFGKLSKMKNLINDFMIFKIDEMQLPNYEIFFSSSDELLIPDEEEEKLKKTIEIAKEKYRASIDKKEKTELYNAYQELKNQKISINIQETNWRKQND